MDEQKFVCCECIEDTYLNEQLKENSEVQLCSYCGDTGVGGELTTLADMVDLRYREYYAFGESYPVFHGDSDRPDYEQQGDYPEDIINMMIKPSDSEISDDICAYLAEDEGFAVVKDGADPMYDDTYCYQHIEIGSGLHNDMWRNFCEDIKHGSRFFSLEAESTLSEVFKNINGYSSTSGISPIREISERDIYRARKANTSSEIRQITSQPEVELNAPPKHLARNGRMNPVGVSIFYGAFDKATCIAELRPAVGETIVCGMFEETKPLRVFDFTVLNDIYDELSIFDPEYSDKLSQIQFLRNFESIISKAFLPNDTALEYLPLQAMTEYLSRYLEGGVDGIIYPSAQKEGNSDNIVIFDHTNRKIVGEGFISYEESPEPYLKFVGGSISVHKIESVVYEQTETSLDNFLMDREYGGH